MPLEWGILFWQWAVTVLILWGCWRISRRCFAEAHAQWAAVTLVAVLLTLPVSGTGLTLTDQYLHPRALATALILAAIVAVLDGRAYCWRARCCGGICRARHHGGVRRVILLVSAVEAEKRIRASGRRHRGGCGGAVAAGMGLRAGLGCVAAGGGHAVVLFCAALALV